MYEPAYHDYFPQLPTPMLVKQMELLTRTLAFRSCGGGGQQQQKTILQPPQPQSAPVSWKVCNKPSCPCYYQSVDKLDGPRGGQVCPEIDERAIHVSNLRQTAQDEVLRDAGGPTVVHRMAFNRRGYAELFFGSHDEAMTAWAALEKLGYQVNFKRILLKDKK